MHESSGITTVPARGQKLGEELPVFCEKCGYSLHGLPSNHCGQCQLLHFVCPECGHHQPINTLRPAFQRALGRARAAWLVGSVLFRMAFIAFFLFMWCVMGAEWFRQYRYRWSPTGAGYEIISELRAEMIVGFTCFALPWAFVCRMMLLRWRYGWIVGLIMAALTCIAMLAGAYVTCYPHFGLFLNIVSASSFQIISLYTFVLIVLMSWATWGIWLAMVRIFLPKATGNALLAWQESLSTRPDSVDTRALSTQV